MTNPAAAPAMPKDAPDAFDEAMADGFFTVIDRSGRALRLPGLEGLSLMEILRGFDVPVLATCGGAAACGTCHVYVDAEFLSRLAPARSEEEWQLDRLVHASATSRLSCQIIWRKEVLDGLSVTLAPEG